MCPQSSEGVQHASGDGQVDHSQFTKIDEHAHGAANGARAQRGAQQATASVPNAQKGGFPRYADFLSNTSNFKVSLAGSVRAHLPTRVTASKAEI